MTCEALACLRQIKTHRRLKLLTYNFANQKHTDVYTDILHIFTKSLSYIMVIKRERQTDRQTDIQTERD